MKLSYRVESTQLLREFLQAQRYSKKTLSAIKRNGALFVNNRFVTVREVLQPGDIVDVHLQEEQYSDYLQPFQQDLKILYEDQFLLIVSKGAQQNCAPSREHPHGSLIEQALGYLQSTDETVPHIVTRLDRNTLGIVIFAKHGFIHHLMSSCHLKKWYLAVCEGHTPREGLIDAPIGRRSNSIIERQVTAEGKRALTRYTTLQTSHNYSLCEAQLITGRTHQLRVHFAHIHHPIVGDSLYGGAHSKYSSQLLRCVCVHFQHPITNKQIEIKDNYHSIETIFNMV
ncbi:RluA family pseudouridine synthase [Staphylococcus argensis]|uniref:RluA family pseudouridine synthase n=1 Tax=Staphylococcus argensis TaxID=1607738 RepID=UPI0011A72165|nr:RluA family pseudouridine synthase [Staphylococcus argensis]MCY6991104.1 RluA family pseudouridine synthase [Staphylococcus argensis]